MLLTDFTTFGEIRSVLGVSDDELGDDILGLDLYLFSLRADLRGVATALPAEYVTVAGKDEGSRTEYEQNFYEMVRLFATYSVAQQLTSSLPLFAPKGITDGKASLTRDSNSPYKDVIARCLSEYARFKALLGDAYDAYKGLPAVSDTLPNYFLNVAPATDPVTGS